MTGFEHPTHLYFLAGIPGLLLLYAGWRIWRIRALARLGDPALLTAHLPRPLYEGLRLALWAVALVLLVLAWANPQGGTVLTKQKQESMDLVIALDVSSSMLAQDVSPNRLELARLFARRLIDALPGERIGLVFFAGEAALQMPLSTDASAAQMLLRNANPATFEPQGTHLAQAIAVAQRCFVAGSEGAGRALVVITDGEDHEGEAETLAKQCFEQGTVLFVVGVGTPEGGAVPLGPHGVKRDDAGNPVISRLNTDLLSQLAGAGGGRAFDLRRSQTTLSALLAELKQLDKRSTSVLSLAQTQSFYAWLLLPAWLLLCLWLWIPAVKPPNTQP